MHFKFIGLVLLIFLWPSFNVMTSIPDLTLRNILSSALLLQQAYLQTFLCLLSGVITTFALRIYGEKIQINQFISSIINVVIHFILDRTIDWSIIERYNRSFCFFHFGSFGADHLLDLLEVLLLVSFERIST